ncbi:hypothetical protein [Streptodolium elevatio]
MLFDPVFGPYHNDTDFLGDFYNEILHQDTCSPYTAAGVEVLAWLAVDDRVPAPHRMGLVDLLFSIATVGERQAAECWPDGHPNADPVSEARAREAVETITGPVSARWDAECTAVRLALAQLAGAFPARVGPGLFRRLRDLADRMCGTAAGDLLDFVAVILEGDETVVHAAVEHHTRSGAENYFQGAARDLPVRVRALHLLDQMFFFERRRLIALLPPQAKP